MYLYLLVLCLFFFFFFFFQAEDGIRYYKVTGVQTCALPISWHAPRAELLGPGAPGWLPPAIVAAAAVALPTLTSLCVLFSEPLFSVLLEIGRASCRERV